uniref:Uncharacterized protein n=1 Tax=Anopheles culicifacies TaxID=139723 RepID=A0A182LXU2_9DIPT
MIIVHVSTTRSYARTGSTTPGSCRLGRPVCLNFDEPPVNSRLLPYPFPARQHVGSDYTYVTLVHILIFGPVGGCGGVVVDDPNSPFPAPNIFLPSVLPVAFDSTMLFRLLHGYKYTNTSASRLPGPWHMHTNQPPNAVVKAKVTSFSDGFYCVLEHTARTPEKCIR